jgi:hypothetical protein
MFSDEQNTTWEHKINSGEHDAAHGGVSGDATGSYTLLSALWTHLKG